MTAITPTNQLLNKIDDQALALITQRLPKVEIHRHLEAGFSLERFLQVAATHGVKLPASDLEGLRPFIQIGPSCESLAVFLEKFPLIQEIFVSREAIEELTYFTVRDAAAENIKHIELRFAPACMAERHNLDFDQVMQGVIDGAGRGSAKGDIGVGLIVIAERHRGIAHAHEMKELALKYRSRGIIGFDLAGNEFDFPPAPFSEAFQDAKARGLNITAHAGEAAGPENIRTVIEEFGATRVGHATSLFSDASVVELIRANDIHIESCPECNVRIGSCNGGYAQHPLPRFLEIGLNVGINTDDPLILGTTASSERAIAVRRLSLGFDDLRILDLNSAQACFISDHEKSLLLNTVQEGYSDVADAIMNGEFKPSAK